jgi:hypothetical protein
MHGYFTEEKLDTLISFVFDPVALSKFTFNDARKLAYISSEILSSKILPIIEFFFNKEVISGGRKSSKTDEAYLMSQFEVEKEVLLSPSKSSKSKSIVVIETCNRSAMNYFISRALTHENMNETRAGYFTKILIFFLNQNKNDFLSFFFASEHDYAKYLQFIEYDSILEFISSMLLIEETQTNDSLNLQESNITPVNNLSSIKISFWIKIILIDTFKDKFEVANNVRTMINSFFIKYFNLSQNSEFMSELLSNYEYFHYLRSLLMMNLSASVHHEIFQIIKSIALFLVATTETDNEATTTQTKTIFAKNTKVFNQLIELIKILQSKLEKVDLTNSWTNSFERNSQMVTIKNFTCLFEIFVSMMKQKVTPVHFLFLNRQFFTLMLVF